MAAYKVYFAESVYEFIAEHVYSERVLAKFEQYRELLSQYPALGAVYDPDYEAARPPVTCRYIPLPETPFTLYYAIDEEREQVHIFHVEFKAANPMHRFERRG